MKHTFRDYLAPLLSSEKQQIARQLFLGIPFYGYDDRNAIIGSQFLAILQENEVEIRFREKEREHEVQYTDKHDKRHVVFYPSLRFLEDRIMLAKKLKCGIGIWELGQGLDYFMDLLFIVCSSQTVHPARFKYSLISLKGIISEDFSTSSHGIN